MFSFAIFICLSELLTLFEKNKEEEEKKIVFPLKFVVLSYFLMSF